MDIKKDRVYCTICQLELSSLKLRKAYNCKKCDQQVCASCSSNRIMIYCAVLQAGHDITKPQRSCQFCFEDDSIVGKYIKDFGLKWNTKSRLMTKWIGKAKPREIKLRDFVPDMESIQKDVETGRSDPQCFNFSLREFLARCQQGVKPEQARQSIIKVLSMMVTYQPTLGYCQGMNQLATFLLCIADEEGAFQLMALLFDRVIPPRFYQGNGGTALIGYQGEQAFLKSMIRTLFPEQYKDRLTNFLEIQGPQFLLTMLLQSFNASAILIIYDEIFKNSSFSVVDKALLHVLDISKDMALDRPQIIESIQRKVQPEELKKYIQQEIFTDFERKIIIEQYFAEQSRKWVDDEKPIQFRLKKITQFDLDEVKEIQLQFKKYCVEATHGMMKKQKTLELDDGHFTGSSDEELDMKTQIKQILQTKLFKFGIDFQTFIQLMNQFHLEYDLYQKLPEHYYRMVFDLFDENKTSLLDFREFICCLSILLRGTPEQKLKMLFQSWNKEQLPYKEFANIMSIVIDQNTQNTKEFDQFMSRYQKQTYTYLEILHMCQDSFLHNPVIKERRGTCLALVNCIQQQNATLE